MYSHQSSDYYFTLSIYIDFLKILLVVVFLVTSTCAVDLPFNLPEGI